MKRRLRSNRTEMIRSYISNISSFHFPRSLIFGPKVADRIGEEVKTFRRSHVLIVTDETMVALGTVDKIRSILEKEGLTVEIYDKVEPDPHIETANIVADLAKKSDIIVGLGGGSSMDMAKVASISNRVKKSIKEVMGFEKVNGEGLPLICIPTTSGTGSEVTPYAVLTIGTKKKAIASYHIVPNLALVDPLLTFTMPPKITAGSGIDALSHAIESMISLKSTPLTDALALQSIQLISKYLILAYHQGTNYEARCNMSLAATIAGLSFSSTGVVHGHSVAQTFAPIYRVPHGISCAITLPYIMEFYVPVVAPKLAEVARVMGIPTQHKSPREAALMAVQAVHQLIHELDVPRLSNFGVTRERLPSLAEACVSDWSRANSPRQFTERSALTVFEKMLTNNSYN